MNHLKKFNEEGENRERINLSHINLKFLIHEGKTDGYKLVDHAQIYFDGEKKYCEYKIVILRESDGSFFEGTYNDWGSGGMDIEPNFKQVFPRQKTITVYENKINEASLSSSREKEKVKQEIKGGNQQDIVHWEVVIENGEPFMRISTDDDDYFIKLNNEEKHKNED